MKRLPIFILSFFLVSIAFAQHKPKVKANYQLAARFSPDNLKRMVFSTRVDPHWLKQSNRFWYTYETSEGKSYYIVDPVKKTKTSLFDNTRMAADMTRLTGDPYDAKHLDIEKLEFINNEKILRFQVKSKLVKEEEKDDKDEEEERGEQQEGDKKEKSKKKKMVDKVYYFEYNLANRSLKLLQDYDKPKDDKKWASISPDERYVLFSRNYNLYWMDMENYAKAQKKEKDSTIVEHQLTEDGVEYFGYGGGTRGETNIDKEKNKDKRKSIFVVWSADSKKFAINRTDLREVKDLWVINSTANPRPTLETYKYPMPGDKEVGTDMIQIFDFASKSQITVKLDTFPDQSVSISRAPRLKKNRDNKRKPSLWLSKTSDKLYFMRTSRDMKRIDFCVADVNTGEVKVLVEERLNTYVEARTPGLVNNGQEIIEWSERDGWAHFYLYDGNGNVKNQITKGTFHCQSLEGIDEKNRVLYFTANGREKGEDPYYYHLYKINFNGSGLKLLNTGNHDNASNLNDDATYFVNNYSRVNTTPVSVLYDNLGRKVMNLETADLSKLFEL